MIDPRLQEILEFLDEVGEDGKPSKRAQIARKIQEYSEDVEVQRAELARLEGDIGNLQTAATAVEDVLKEQASRKIDLVSEAQDASVRAALVGSGGAAAGMRKQARLTRQRVREFDRDFANQKARVSQAQVPLIAKEKAIKDMRDSIVRRLNTMSSLAERAGLEFGIEWTASPAQPKRSQARSPRAGAPRMARRGPRRVKVRRRRAS